MNIGNVVKQVSNISRRISVSYIKHQVISCKFIIKKNVAVKYRHRKIEELHADCAESDDNTTVLIKLIKAAITSRITTETPGYILFYCASPKGLWYHSIVTQFSFITGWSDQLSAKAAQALSSELPDY